jgi:hypothetical protein
MTAAKQFEDTFWLGMLANPQATLAAVQAQRIECAAKRDAYGDMVTMIERLLAENEELDRWEF